MSWLRTILVSQFAEIRRDEWPRALLMSAFFFLVIATFWVLKPLKRGVLINYFAERLLQVFGFALAGAESEQVAKILNLVVVSLVMIFFTWLVRRFPRHHLVLIFSGIYAAAFLGAAAVIDEPTEPVVWAFFVLGDMFNTTFVALFWAFNNDIAGTAESKRTYGIIGLGGVVGGFMGATLVESTVVQYGRPTLLVISVVPLVLMTGIAFLVQRRLVDRGLDDGDNRAAAERTESSPAIEGARLVFRSRYLLAVVTIIACYEIVSNVVDFQLAATVERNIQASLEKDAFFGLVGQLVGVTSIVVQLLFTSFVMRRFRIRVALSVLPAAIFASSIGFLLFPSLLFAAAMSTSDNALNYSIHQSAKEALYVPTSPEVTYKAKAFIDMFVQRFGKVLSVGVNLSLVSVATVGVRWLSLLSMAILFLWSLQIKTAGRIYREKSAGRQAEPEGASGA